MKSIAPHLRIITELATTVNGKKRSAKSGASFSRCVLSPPALGQTSFGLEVEVRWLVGLSVVETSGQTTPCGKRDMSILSKYMSEGNGQANTPWVLSDFYDSVSKNSHVDDQICGIVPSIRRQRDLVESGRPTVSVMSSMAEFDRVSRCATYLCHSRTHCTNGLCGTCANHFFVYRSMSPQKTLKFILEYKRAC